MAIHGTTILAVRHQGVVAIGGDGQVTLGSAIMKSDAVKIRRLLDGKVLCGFAGSTADAFALLEKFEQRLKDSPANLLRAATDLARQWRTDKILRQLEAFLLTTDGNQILLISGTGDVIQPTDGIAAVGSGGNYAIAAARGLLKHSTLDAVGIVREAMAIAAGIDIYTNGNTVIEVLAGSTRPA